ncbi:hypothetical protein G4B88_017180 [Cannabis sativa]|uniref:DUF4283 domain-containing protein n=1 Tax=Cannabis sativa TaxID=3483 RepID=A0A7J6DNQ3_CANSA|nr:hypothetical protein G4B88_017180 [Cannabis sativa]
MEIPTLTTTSGRRLSKETHSEKTLATDREPVVKGALVLLKWRGLLLSSLKLHQSCSVDLGPSSITPTSNDVLQLDEIDGPVIKLNKESLEDGKRRFEELSGENVLRFFFGSKEDRKRVFGGGPWMFEKQLICFVKLMGLGEVSKMTFDHDSFWISINNVPLACMPELFAREWRILIGKVKDTFKIRKQGQFTMKGMDCGFVLQALRLGFGDSMVVANNLSHIL